MKFKRTIKFKLPNDNRLISLLKYLREIKNYIAFVCIEGNFKSLKKLHKAVYYKIREKYPFIPARFIIDIEREVLAIIKAVRKSKSSFYSFKSYSAWLTKGQSFNFDWDSISIIYEAYGSGKKAKWILFRIRKDKRYSKYKDWNFKEARLKFDGNLWFYLIVEKEVELKNTKKLIGVDINFDNVTLSNKVKIPYDLKRGLAIQESIERIMKKYNKQWRCNKGILRAIRRRWRNLRNYLNDLSWKVALKVVSFGANIVLENLKGLKNVDLGRKFNKRLNLFVYRKIQRKIEIKAEEFGLRVIYVNAKGTSSYCPKCGNKTIKKSYKLLYCKNCNMEWDRDYLASLNILKRGMKMWVVRQPELLQLDATPRRMKR
ncbi:hypothetical protein DRN69_03935 [Candidatus Pacearchaeota archaeon]|nr:MAG: hypothetical protein DRN69_03935 [Candidatus Pacearchaeota archaeon]